MPWIHIKNVLQVLGLGKYPSSKQSKFSSFCIVIVIIDEGLVLSFNIVSLIVVMDEPSVGYSVTFPLFLPI